MSVFQKAKKSQAKLRLGLGGVSGGGKTFTALSIAKGLGGKTAVIDTENASASKYADKFDFDTLVLSEYAPDAYVRAIKAAENEGYDNIIIDSTTHAWEAVKDMAEAAGARMKNNTFAGWKDATKEYQKLTNAIIQSTSNVIATIRAKEEHAQDIDDSGRKVVKKLGLGLQAGKNQEFEYDIILMMEDGGKAVVTKSRYDKLTGKVLLRPGEELGKELARWLSDGEAVLNTPVTPVSPEFFRLSGGIVTSTQANHLAVVAVEIKDAQAKGEVNELEVAALRDQYIKRQEELGLVPKN